MNAALGALQRFGAPKGVDIEGRGGMHPFALRSAPRAGALKRVETGATLAPHCAAHSAGAVQVSGGGSIELLGSRVRGGHRRVFLVAFRTVLVTTQ